MKKETTQWIIQDLEEKQVKYVCKMRGIQNKTNKKKRVKKEIIQKPLISMILPHIYTQYIYIKYFKSIHRYRHKFLMKNFNVKNENQTAKASN